MNSPKAATTEEAWVEQQCARWRKETEAWGRARAVIDAAFLRARDAGNMDLAKDLLLKLCVLDDEFSDTQRKEGKWGSK